ncbi:Transient receptor potential cation channel subfamily A member 1 -like protein [Caligus rogercresseyi]|uniref:Transient receptor potential cation channel subfamily A member 1 -like protein n=1 Tax=Caligus rogercresseyi TaxID=217165 RepID=A0A7T8GYN6_CALRO|nr:Transient receptor potential cation channel subfamily A member 1 -like protein [Caligus rogercresseyi]
MELKWIPWTGRIQPPSSCSQFGHEKMVRLLLSRGASLKQEDADGHNALEIALLGKKKVCQEQYTFK